MNSKKDPWHFSHLGEEYFLQISSFFGSSNIKNDLIDNLHIGCTGEPYIEKKNGRLVNPNWCIRLKNGENFKSRTVKRALFKKGLWKLSNCITLKWNEISDFYYSK
jgi:hypothetical protein